MSLYNLLFGVNEIAPLLLFVLDIDQPDDKWDSGRFRDIYLNKDGTIITLYTRNGGGNRDHWSFSYSEYTEGEECPCAGCIISHKLPKHPNYLRDHDDVFDSTYAYVEFSVPDQFKDICKGLASNEEPEKIHEKFSKYTEELKAGKKEVPDVIKKTIEKMVGIASKVSNEEEKR